MKGPPKHLLAMVGKVRTMNPAQIYQWASVIYREGFEAGLREAEREFDGAIIMDIDEALSRGINLDGLEDKNAEDDH